MTALLRTGVAVAFGLVVGALAMVGLQQAGGAPQQTVVSEPPPAPAPEKPAPTPDPAAQVLLAWTPGGLPDGFAEAVGTVPRIDAVTEVRGGLVELVSSRDADGKVVDAPEPGFVIPLDAIAFDPDTYPAFLSKSAVGAFEQLRPGEALLGATAADLRDLGPGAVLELADAQTLTVAGVVDDAHVGAAEIAVARDTLRLPSRYLLLLSRSERAAVEESLRAALPGDTPLRLRGPGETPYFRHGDAVLPQAVVKERFGEFAYRRGAGREFVQEPGWAGDHIVGEEVPLLGRVACHRAIIPAVRGALGELEQRGLGWLVQADGYAGCHSARLTSSLDSVSRHAWGIALDLNAHKNPYGQASTQDPRLVEVFERWGFTWGGEWLIPDAAHFEFVRPPG